MRCKTFRRCQWRPECEAAKSTRGLPLWVHQYQEGGIDAADLIYLLNGFCGYNLSLPPALR